MRDIEDNSGIEITIHDTPQSTGFAERGISQIKKSIEDHMSQQAIRTSIHCIVDAYGCVRFNREEFYIGEELVGERINLCIDPSCLGHMCAKSDSVTGIVDSESEQSIPLKTSKEIIVQETLLPTFCSYILRQKGNPLQKFKQVFRVQKPVSLRDRIASILLGNKYFNLTINTCKRFKNMFSRFVIVNENIKPVSQKFNSLIHTINPKNQTNGGKVK